MWPLKGKREGSHVSLLLPGVIGWPGTFTPGQAEDNFNCLLSSIFVSVIPQFISINPYYPLIDSCGLILTNALNLEQYMNQNCFYPSMLHIRTSTWKLCRPGNNLKCVMNKCSQWRENLRGKVISHIVSQNLKSLPSQGFLEGQDVSSFGENLTCSESVSCLFRPRNQGGKSNQMNLLSLESTLLSP